MAKNYNYEQTSEATVIHAKLVDHARVLQRILVGKKAAYTLEPVESWILEAINTLAGELSGSMKIESKEMMTVKVAQHAYTLAEMLMWMGAGQSVDYERTADEEMLWNVIKGSLVNRSPYYPRSK